MYSITCVRMWVYYVKIQNPLSYILPGKGRGETVNKIILQQEEHMLKTAYIISSFYDFCSILMQLFVYFCLFPYNKSLF